MMQVRKVNVVIGRTGEMRTVRKDDNPDKVLNSQHIPYGSFIYVKDGKAVKKDEAVCRWDPYNNVIVSEMIRRESRVRAYRRET
jgi:DNA-directed RNA polymerase subunit beta'